MEETHISHEKSHAFSKELSKYLEAKGDLFKCTEAPYDRNTRAQTMSIVEARQACDDYILVETDFPVSPCSFSEAPAESIFSTYERVTKGRESIVHDNYQCCWTDKNCLPWTTYRYTRGKSIV